MNTKSKYSSVSRNLMVILIFSAALFSCGKNNPSPNTEPIPNVAVNEYLNLQLPSNISLTYPGAWLLISGGNKGIFLYHNYDDTYLAFDRTCSYKPNDACSKLTPDTSGFFLGCGSYDPSKNWVPCCGSRFQFDGTITQSPAIYPLKKYSTTLDGSVLHIFN